ncbi:hypothetical protein DWF74_11150 [Pseudomonas protegens]|nr:hypothetical protein DWF74_11150 [Pseudomonas protegens]
MYPLLFARNLKILDDIKVLCTKLLHDISVFIRIRKLQHTGGGYVYFPVGPAQPKAGFLR